MNIFYLLNIMKKHTSNYNMFNANAELLSRNTLIQSDLLNNELTSQNIQYAIQDDLYPKANPKKYFHQ